VGNPEGKSSLGRKRSRLEGNFKVDFKYIGWGGMDWIEPGSDRDQWRALANTELKHRVPKNFGKILNS
jgi:hypothetical protein